MEIWRFKQNEIVLLISVDMLSFLFFILLLEILISYNKIKHIIKQKLILIIMNKIMIIEIISDQEIMLRTYIKHKYLLA